MSKLSKFQSFAVANTNEVKGGTGACYNPCQPVTVPSICTPSVTIPSATVIVGGAVNTAANAAGNLLNTCNNAVSVGVSVTASVGLFGKKC